MGKKRSKKRFIRRHRSAHLGPEKPSTRQSEWEKTGIDSAPAQPIREMKQMLSPEELARRLHEPPPRHESEWFASKLRRLAQKAKRLAGGRQKKGGRHNGRRGAKCSR